MARGSDDIVTYTHNDRSRASVSVLVPNGVGRTGGLYPATNPCWEYGNLINFPLSDQSRRKTAGVRAASIFAGDNFAVTGYQLDAF